MTLLSNLWLWLQVRDHWLGSDGLLPRLAEHLWYVAISMLIASLIALPLGIFLGHRRRGAAWVINLFNMGRAIPSLGLVLLSIILIGYGDMPVFIALVALSIPPILTNAWAGVYQVDSQLRDAARAMGMTAAQRLWQMEIPLALPLIFAGIRTSLVQLIATATIAAYAGLGGLGRFLIDGLGQRDIPQVLAGSLAVTLLALCCEALLAHGQKKLFPAFALKTDTPAA
ncbi:Glycine betaine ABC transport system permease protein [Paramixta manurensis]|uniref:Glycine betaine ABC transport system permease protein n=1 Tax=Paramixta manurensis TaxID=2740817 RepID=A0A6M8UEP6_9GAMM|nr:Glycine betaine ABC transport system permease protein [Erwiniaceae bacterium PD-1]